MRAVFVADHHYPRRRGLYGERILPRLVDRTCGIAQLDPLRARVCEPLAGAVLEIGFGSGHNVGHYPPAVTAVSAVEPADTAWRLAADRVAASRVPIERSGLDGEHLPFPDDSFDSALSTFTMCTIPDLPRALAELARVLRPGATVSFLEHGRAPDADVRRWQRRLEPIQRRVAGGCHLTRDIPGAIEAAGLIVGPIDAFYLDGAGRAVAAMTLGTARVPN
ncbi:class I SAM-dependent methyltransferase [Millisia brevis]|uniref:class I SAM-dependent methyltransferase n=1 Tax=Millisia brevis TaxID=264148 RepID=UPI0009FCDD39